MQQRPIHSSAELPLGRRRGMFCTVLMSFRSTVLVGISLTVLGCATEPPISEAQWRWEKEYEQQGARDEGRIGYIGNAGGTAGN